MVLVCYVWGYFGESVWVEMKGGADEWVGIGIAMTTLEADQEDDDE